MLEAVPVVACKVDPTRETDRGGASRVLMRLTGTVSDFDDERFLGLIVADDGRIVVFNLDGAPPAQKRLFDVGTRVEFSRLDSGPSPRAIELVPIQRPEAPDAGPRQSP